MTRTRKGTLKSLVLGLLAAILFTLLSMLALSAVLVWSQMSDGTLRLLNQLVKLAAIFIGTGIAVPRGGEKGLVTGTVLALLYIILGYISYLALGGGSFSFGCMLGEMLLGSAVGAITGVVRANLNPKRRRTAAS